MVDLPLFPCVKEKYVGDEKDHGRIEKGCKTQDGRAFQQLERGGDGRIPTMACEKTMACTTTVACWRGVCHRPFPISPERAPIERGLGTAADVY